MRSQGRSEEGDIVTADTGKPDRGMQCHAENAGLDGCQSPVSWVVKAASARMFACGRHLNKVCLQMIRTGAEFMTVTIHA